MKVIRHDESLPDSARRTHGIYYTPTCVADYMAELCFRGTAWKTGAWLDPACGDGEFLLALIRAGRRHWSHSVSDADFSLELGWIKSHLFAMDIDPAAVVLARQNVARMLLGPAAVEQEVVSLASDLSTNIVCGDTLLGDLPTSWPQRFAVAIGNPPYVNIRRLANDDARVFQLRRRFQCARGAFDLYILFLERAWELLQPAGTACFIVPNKLASLNYASACRDLLTKYAKILSLIDCSEASLFAAARVYPYVIQFERGQPSREHPIEVLSGSTNTAKTAFHVTPIASVSQQEWRRGGTWSWSRPWSNSPRVRCVRLADIARLHSGSTGFQAQQLAISLQEDDGTHAGRPFIVSGNIDPFRLQLGDVRFMKRRFDLPRLPDNAPHVSADKWRLYRQPKIVIAGMSRRIEAAWDDVGCALGVQVFAITAWQVDPFYLLALLNSQYLADWFQTRFAAKRLGGGYFSLNKGQLAELPIPLFDTSASHSLRIATELQDLAQLCTLATNDIDRARHQQSLEQLVNELYGADDTSAVERRLA